MPFFSIILPTYNRAERIKSTIRHVLDQDFDDFELIIVDDGSKDNTAEVVKSFADPRIRYHFKENEERAIARNTGIQMAEGNYITFVDSDDAVYPVYLSSAHKLCSEYDNPPWMHLNYEIKDQSGKVLRKAPFRRGDLVKQLITGNHLSCLGIFVKREVLEEERFDEDPRLIGSEDYDLWLRIGKKYPLTYSNEPVAAIIQHQDRSVMEFSKEKLIERIHYLIQKHQDLRTFTNKEYRTFISHRYMYLALHLAMGAFLKDTVKFLYNSVAHKPGITLSAKFIGVIKVILKQIMLIR